MINLLTGRLGSGKSYEAVVYHIITNLEKGRAVVTNMPLNLQFIESIHPEWLPLITILTYTPEDGFPFSTVEHYQHDWRNDKNQGVFIVIDECQNVLRDKLTPLPIIEWFEMSRHSGNDVLLITQSVSNLDKTIRGLVQTVYKVSNNRTLGLEKTYTRKVYDGVRGSLCDTSVRTYQKGKFKFYKSHTLSDGSVNEAGVQDVKPIYYHWSFIGAALFLLIGIPLTVKTVLDFHPPGSASSSVKTDLPAVQKGNTPVIQPTPSVVQPKQKDPERTIEDAPFSNVDIHISGFIQNNKKLMYQFSMSQNGQEVFTISNRDLEYAGYQISPLGPCSAKIIYRDQSQYVTCDSPRVSMMGQTGFANR